MLKFVCVFIKNQKTLTKNKECANIGVADKGSVLFDKKIVLNLKQVLRVYCLTITFRTLIFEKRLDYIEPWKLNKFDVGT